jgi:hypothetical protein
MPTPFTHLNAAQRFLADTSVPQSLRVFLETYLGAFLMGNFSPDAHHVTQGQLKREDTHFFEYREKVDPPAIQALLKTYPTLNASLTHTPEQAAFVAGYIAHLIVDQIWCEAMLFPHFYVARWRDLEHSKIALHCIITSMDMRDYEKLNGHHYRALKSAHPQNWLPFLSDIALQTWSDMVTEQFNPNGGKSKTLEILGKRIKMTAEEFQALMVSEERLQTELWDYIPKTVLAHTEEAMYQAMRASIMTYLEGSV